MWCVGLFNSVYVQWNLYYNCKFTKFDTKLNIQIPVEFRSKEQEPEPEQKCSSGTGTGIKIPVDLWFGTLITRDLAYK